MRCELQRSQACLTLVPQSTCCRAQPGERAPLGITDLPGMPKLWFAGGVPACQGRLPLLAVRDELQELSELGRDQCVFRNQKTPLGSPGYVCQPWNPKQEQVLGFKLSFPLECVLELSDAGCKQHRAANNSSSIMGPSSHSERVTRSACHMHPCLTQDAAVY